MRCSNGLHSLLQSFHTLTSQTCTVGLFTYFFYSIFISSFNVSALTSSGLRELTICAGEPLNVTCPLGHVIIFTSVIINIQNTSHCSALPNTTKQDHNNCTSANSLLPVYRECYPSRECYIKDVTSLLHQYNSCNNSHTSHLYLKYTCINESNIIHLCDGQRSQQISYDEEGVIFSPRFGGEFPSKNNSYNRATNSCNIVLTPVHGQFVHFDLISLSSEQTDIPCARPSLHFTADNDPNLQLCPSSTMSQILLSDAKFSSVNMSHENQLTNQTADQLDVFLITYKAQGCTTKSIPLVNNKTLLSEYTYGEEAVIQCGDGLQKVSSQTGVYICRDGWWQGTAPNCTEIGCDPVDVSENSVVEYRTAGNGADQVHTRCEEGYALGGDAVRTCMPNNTWNGTQPFCQIVNCGSLPTIPNGQVTYTYSTFGSTATYTCIQGYHLIGGATRTCQQDSQWSGTEPLCSRIVCGHPGVPDNGEADPSKLSDYPTGTIISYLCYTGYKLTGAAQITCDEDGSWSKTAPLCLIVDCGPPPDLLNAQPVFNSTTFEAHASYTCNPGFDTLQPGLLNCTENATWQGSLPQCQDTFPVSSTTVQYSSTPAVSSIKHSQNSTDSVKNGLIGGAVAVGVLLIILLLWIFHLYRKRRKVRLKRPEDMKTEENGFFEKSNEFYDNDYAYMVEEPVNSKTPRNSVHAEYPQTNTYEMCHRNGTDVSSHRQNGAVRSNGSLPHSNHNSISSSDNNVYKNEKCETSKI